MSSLCYSISEVCAAARAGRTAVYAAIKSGELIARKRGRKTLILDCDLRRWVEGLPALTPNPKSETKLNRSRRLPATR
jgi:hypothetical protein